MMTQSAAKHSDDAHAITAAETYWQEIPLALKSAFRFDALKATMLMSCSFLVPIIGLWSVAYFTTVIQSAAVGETGLGRLVRLKDEPVQWFMVWLSYCIYFGVAIVLLAAGRALSLVDFLGSATAFFTVVTILITPMALLAIALNETVFKATPWEILRVLFSNLIEYVLWTVTMGLGLFVLVGSALLATEVSIGLGIFVWAFVAIFGLPHLALVGAHLLGRIAYHSDSHDWATEKAHKPGKPVNTILAVAAMTVYAGFCIVLYEKPPSADAQINDLVRTYLKGITQCGTGWKYKGPSRFPGLVWMWRRITNPTAGIYRRADSNTRRGGDFRLGWSPDVECKALFGDELLDFDYTTTTLQNADKATVLVTGNFRTNDDPTPVPKVFTIHLTNGNSDCPTGSECVFEGSCEPDGTVEFPTPPHQRCEFFAPKIWTIGYMTQ